MNERRAAVVGGLTALLALAVYAVLAGIAPTPVSEPTPRIPGLLFAVIIPGSIAFGLGAGSVVLRRRFGLRLPMAGLVGGAVLAVLTTPTAGEAWLLVFGAPAWLTLFGAVELLVRWATVRREGGTLDRDEHAGVVGTISGLAYSVVFVVAAAVPAWSNPELPTGPGSGEIVLTTAFLAGAFCLLLGVPVALARRGGPYSPLLIPALWVGYDVLSGWQFYDGEPAVIAFTLGWPAAMVLIVLLAAVESSVRWGWRRFRLSARL